MKKYSRYILVFALIVVVFVPTLLLLAGCPMPTYEYEGICYTIYSDHAEVNYFICEEGGTMVCEVPSEMEYDGKLYPVTAVTACSYSSRGQFVEGGYASEIILPETVVEFQVYDYDDYYSYIGGEYHYEFEHLQKITVHPDNPVYSSIDGVLFDASGEELLYYPRAKQDETFTVPKSMRSIHPSARIWNNSILEQIEVDGDNTYYTVDDNVLYSCDGSELVYRHPNANETHFAIPSTVSVVCYNALPGIEYLFVPKSVALFLESFVDSEKSINEIKHIYFEADSLPNYLTKSSFRGELHFGATLQDFQEAVQ